MTDDEQVSTYQATTADRTVHTVHARIQTGSTNINPPHEVKRLILQMRKGDPMIQIVPIQVNDNNANEKIGHENEFPEDEIKMKKWVENVRTENTKIHFTMKVKTMNIDNVKTAVFNWCKGNGRYVTFTRLESSRIFTGGWFHGIHPFYYNRDDFSAYLFTHLPDFKDRLDIYQKKVWKWNNKKEKIITLAIVIDGDFDIKDQVFDFLFSHKFQGRYKNVTFVPYSTNDDFSHEDQIRLLISNNEYQANLSRMILKVRNANTKYDIDGEKISFQDWLAETTIDGQKVIQGVEVAPDDVVRVLFHKDDANVVRDAIHDLYGFAEEVFGPELASKMLDENNLRRAKLSVDSERAYSQKLKTISGNPQDIEDQTKYHIPKQTKARTYYGSYLEVAQSNQTQTSELTHDSGTGETDLRKQVEAIATAQRNLASNMDASISSAVSKQIAPIQTQINQIKSTHESQVQQFMTLLNTKFESIQNSFLLLGVPAQTPSEANEGPPGVRS